MRPGLRVIPTRFHPSTAMVICSAALVVRLHEFADEFVRPHLELPSGQKSTDSRSMSQRSAELPPESRLNAWWSAVLPPP